MFGSRAKNIDTSISDIDIGIETDKPIEFHKVSLIKEKFENSNIIYKIDIIDFNLFISV